MTKEHLDLATQVKAFCKLIHADAICIWRTDDQKIAIPLASYPSAWLSTPFVMSPMANDMIFHRKPAEVLNQLPLAMRAKLASSPPSALLKIKSLLDNGMSVGIIAIWNDPLKIVSDLQIVRQLTRLTLERLFRADQYVYRTNESNQQMRALADVLPHGVIIVPMDSQAGYVNHVAAKLLGFSKNEVSSTELSSTMQSFLANTINANQLKDYVDAIITDRWVAAENHSQIWRFTNAPKALRVTISPIKTTRTHGWVWLLEDVSKETEYQDQLIIQEQKFRSFYQNMQEAVVSYDMQGTVVESNILLKNLLHLSDQDDLDNQLNIHNQMFGWRDQLWQSVFDDCLKTSVAGPYEKQMRSYHGLLIDVEALAFLRKDAEGNALGIWEVIRDITQKKQADSQLILSAEAFARYSDGVILTDAHECILTANDAFTTAMGFSRDELRGKKPSLFKSGRHDLTFYKNMRQEIHAHGWWQGGIWNRTKAGDLTFKWLTINAVRDNNNALTHYIGVYREAAAVKEAQNRVAYLATHDELTKLPNKMLFQDRLAALINTHKNNDLLAVILIGLDGFQNINNAMGYHYGDAVLKEVAVRLQGTINAGDTVSRLGSDIFAILITASQFDEIIFYCDRILSSINKPHFLEGVPTVVSASLGVSVFPSDSNDAESLLLKADAALHQAKKSEKNSYRFFTADLTTKFNQQFKIENGLRQALKQNEFFLQYQPQISSDKNSVHGCEALIRWQQNDVIISPAAFIPIAEESGLIIPITEWVLRTACKQLALWDSTGLNVLTMSINISARHFQRDNMVNSIRDILAEEHIDPARICLEITEGTLIDVSQCEQKLKALKDIGFSISVDDFGTGFSSLSYLKWFHLDELKIDKSFVDGIEKDESDRAIVSATLSMAHSLDMHVVAEGVETLMQLSYLKDKGCETIQGYYFSKPLSATEFEHFVTKWTLSS
jgi:diguanylate cyclase (GGDEF)-like protein/PAS domain S-box-containing protein